MNREALDRWCERGILGLVLAILVFGPLATGAVRTLEFLTIQGLTMGVMVLWLIRLWVSERPQFLWPPICWVVVAFTGYAIARYLTCEIEYAGRLELLRVLLYAALFFAVLNNLHKQETTQIIAFTLIFLAMGISFYALYQFSTASDKVWHFVSPYKGRGMGTYICPNHLAGFLEMLLPLALAYVLVGRSKPLTKVFLGYAALALMAGIGVTLSRGSWASCAIVVTLLLGLLSFNRNYRLPAVALALCLFLGGAYVVSKTSLFKHRIQRALDTPQVEKDVRYLIWEATVKMWRDHVWFGVGPGHYDYRFREYRPVEIQLRPDRAHNEYLNTLADWGVVGAVLVSSALVALGIGLMKTWRNLRRAENDFRTNRSDRFAFVAGAAMGLLALVIHSLVDFNMQIPANAILAICLMALLSSHLRFATESYWINARKPGKLLATAILLCGLVYLGYQEARLGREYFWLDRAATARRTAGSIFTADEIAAREKAHAAEPRNFENIQEIGEAYRFRSFEGGENYEQLAAQAMKWYDRGVQANPRDGYNHFRYGMCLDWLKRHDEAEAFFMHAEQLDPNGYFTAAHVGWHYIETENYAAARTWSERSLRLQWKSNLVAESQIFLANTRLREAASRTQPSPPARLP